MNDEQCASDWETLAPAAPQRRRMEARVSGWLDAHDTSLAAEWGGLFRVDPWAAIGLVPVSAIAVVVTTPLVWLARALL